MKRESITVYAIYCPNNSIFHIRIYHMPFHLLQPVSYCPKHMLPKGMWQLKIKKLLGKSPTTTINISSQNNIQFWYHRFTKIKCPSYDSSTLKMHLLLLDLYRVLVFKIVDFPVLASLNDWMNWLSTYFQNEPTRKYIVSEHVVHSVLKLWIAVDGEKILNFYTLR